MKPWSNKGTRASWRGTSWPSTQAMPLAKGPVLASKTAWQERKRTESLSMVAIVDFVAWRDLEIWWFFDLP